MWFFVWYPNLTEAGRKTVQLDMWPPGLGSCCLLPQHAMRSAPYDNSFVLLTDTRQLISECKAHSSGSVMWRAEIFFCTRRAGAVGVTSVPVEGGVKVSLFEFTEKLSCRVAIIHCFKLLFFLHLLIVIFLNIMGSLIFTLLQNVLCCWLFCWRKKNSWNQLTNRWLWWVK